MGMTTRKYTPAPAEFKDDQGRWRTKSLFIETNDNETKYPSIFTLGLEERDGRVSMRKVYLKCGDPTEYGAAMAIFGSFDCWERLCAAPFFKPHIKIWRKELQRRIRSEAIDTIGYIAAGTKSTAAQLSAAKWLATAEWDGATPRPNKMGRPPKEQDPVEALREGLLHAEEENEDFDRIIKTRDS
jgi:hypothetical protein